MIARRSLETLVHGSLWLMVAACGDAGGTTGAGTTGADGTSGGSFPATTSGAAPTSGGDSTGLPTSEGAGTGSSGEATTGGGSSGSESTAAVTGETGTETGSTGSTGAGSTGTTGASSTGASSTGETSGETSSEGTTDGGSSSEPAGVCGDGELDAGEACDDGDAIDDDECSNACVLPTCSDGLENGSETAVDCGGPACSACPFALLLGGNASKSVAARFDGAGWTSSDVPAPTVDGVGLVISGDGTGFGVLRYTKIGDPKDKQLQFVTWKAGVWSAPLQIGASTTRAAPTLAAVGDAAQLVFQGEDFKYYYAVHDGMAWGPTAEMVGSFGPGPGALATLGFDAWLVYHDGAGDNRLTTQRRTGAWFGKIVVDTDAQMFDRQPAIAATAADELMVVHARNAGGQLRWSAGPAMWSAPADVAGAQTTDTPALIGLGMGEAALAFRGTDGRPYVARFDGATWSAPAAVLNPNPAIYGAPALARGIGAAELELVYLEAGSKTIRHTRRIAGVWTAPAQVGNTALEHVAIASRP
ncbi:MAG: hypothetical protein JNL82_19495 [Myxococcales bacterium]|nr:hypothetical protein [Myxococcales bacterium]